MKVGVLGGGQLGRMLGLAGIPLGHQFVFFDDGETPCAGDVGEVRPLYGSLDGLDVLTYEFENVFDAVDKATRHGVTVAPSRRAIEVSSDRLAEKDFFTSLQIPTARYRPFGSQQDLESAAADLGLPCVAKTRRFGYDGKGQSVVEKEADLMGLADGTEMILEAYVPFGRELSIVCTRAADGTKAFYPLVQNMHSQGILRTTIAPAPDLPDGMQQNAEHMVAAIANELEYVGTLALELFQLNDELMANEMAPRVHNTGHWSIEGAETSQFENHIRAITGAPLGSTKPRGHCAMVNLIGVDPNPKRIQAIEGAHYHWYGKEVRPGRKVGHVTLVCEDSETLGRRLAELSAVL
jgi:5-(carboxyamino)imidazole ribonucleotide synthase